MRLLFFSESTKDVYSVQGAWYSPNTLPIMVHDHALCIITRQPLSPNQENTPIRHRRLR